MQLMILVSAITMAIGFTLMTVTWIQAKIGVCELCENGMSIMVSVP